MRRRMTATLVAAIMAMPLVAQAEESICYETGIERITVQGYSSQKLIHSPIHYQGEVRLSLVGEFLWIEIGEGEAPVSVEVPADAIFVTACPDGSVVFEHAPAEEAERLTAEEETGEKVAPSEPVDQKPETEQEPRTSTVNVIVKYPEFFEGITAAIY